MYRYGQYCPIAQAVEIVGDRWTLLIIRDLLTGTCHFNELERGLPGISRGLLAERLRRLQMMGLLEKQEYGRSRTRYELTEAGRALDGVIDALLVWGTQWAFGPPQMNELDPVLLLWWMKNRVRRQNLPDQRVVVQFNFTGAVDETLWLMLTIEDVSVCLTYPGFDVNVLVTADIAAFYEVWLGRLEWDTAVHQGQIEVDAIPALARAFPDWFAYSLAAPAVRRVMGERVA
jgi:DNA-binding HxlR family transcriptional regulator